MNCETVDSTAATSLVCETPSMILTWPTFCECRPLGALALQSGMDLTVLMCDAGLSVLADDQGMEVVGKLVAAQAAVFARASLDPVARNAAREAAKEAVMGSYVSFLRPSLSVLQCPSTDTQTHSVK